ncbi:hypothetical protein D3C73_1370170 [compost metagenome]
MFTARRASADTASASAAAVSRVIIFMVKFTEQDVTPSIFLTLFSIFMAQLAQSSPSSIH